TADFGQALRFQQADLAGSEPLFRQLLIGDVDTGANKSGELAVPVERCSVVEHPAVIPIGPLNSVLHLEITASVKGRKIGRQAPPKVLGMDAACPAIPHLLPHGTASELQPRLIEKDAKLVRTGDPYHYRRAIRHGPEALFALAQHSFGLPSLGDFQI